MHPLMTGLNGEVGFDHWQVRTPPAGQESPERIRSSKKWIEMEEITTKFLTSCLKTARKVLLLKVWLQQFQLLCQLNTSVLAEWVKILLTSWGYKEQNSKFMHGIHAGNLF